MILFSFVLVFVLCILVSIYNRFLVCGKELKTSFPTYPPPVNTPITKSGL